MQRPFRGRKVNSSRRLGCPTSFYSTEPILMIGVDQSSLGNQHPPGQESQDSFRLIQNDCRNLQSPAWSSSDESQVVILIYLCLWCSASAKIQFDCTKSISKFCRQCRRKFVHSPSLYEFVAIPVHPFDIFFNAINSSSRPVSACVACFYQCWPSWSFEPVLCNAPG